MSPIVHDLAADPRPLEHALARMSPEDRIVIEITAPPDRERLRETALVLDGRDYRVVIGAGAVHADPTGLASLTQLVPLSPTSLFVGDLALLHLDGLSSLDRARHVDVRGWDPRAIENLRSAPVLTRLGIDGLRRVVDLAPVLELGIDLAFFEARLACSRRWSDLPTNLWVRGGSVADGLALEALGSVEGLMLDGPRLPSLDAILRSASIVSLWLSFDRVSEIDVRMPKLRDLRLELMPKVRAARVEGRLQSLSAIGTPGLRSAERISTSARVWYAERQPAPVEAALTAVLGEDARVRTLPAAESNLWPALDALWRP